MEEFEFDLIRLFEHPVPLHRHLAPAVLVFGGLQSTRYQLDVSCRHDAHDPERQFVLTLRWDFDQLERLYPILRTEIAQLQNFDEDEAGWIEQAAIVVAVAVMARAAPELRFELRSRVGTRHDYYLDVGRTVMIEVAGRTEGGLAGLFEEKREQSNQNPVLAQRWVSVTIFRVTPRNRTERVQP